MPTDNISNDLSGFEITKSLLVSGAPLMFRGFAMAVQVSGQSFLLARDSEETLAKYTAYSAWETLIFIVIFESLQAINTKIAAIDAITDEADKKAVGRIFLQGIIFSGGLFTFSAIASLAAPTVFQLSGESDEVVAGSRSYFLIALLYYLFDTLYRSHVRLMIGLGKQNSTVCADLSEGVLNLGFTAFFVFGINNTPKMGVNGAALGYAVAAVLTMIGYHFYLRRRADLTDYGFFQLQSPLIDRPVLKEMTLNGVCWSANSLLKYSVSALMILILGQYGNNTLAALAPSQAYALFLTYILDGFSEIPISKISAITASDDSSGLIKRVALTAVGISFGFSMLIGALAFIFSQNIVNWFLASSDTSCNDTCVLAEHFLKIQIAAQILLNAGNMSAYSLIATGKKQFPTGVTIGAIFILNIAALMLTKFALKQSAPVVNATQLIGFLVACVLNTAHLYCSNNTEHVVIPQRPFSAAVNRLTSFFSNANENTQEQAPSNVLAI